MKKKNAQRRAGPRKNRSRGDQVAVLPGFPRPVQANPTFRKTFRYVSSSAESKDADTISMASLQNLMFLGIASTSARGVIACFKLVEVEVWGCSSSSAFSTIELDWLGKESSNKTLVSSGSTVVPAHIKSRPPKGSNLRNWYAGQMLFDFGTPTKSDLAFSVLCTSGDIIDVTVDFQLLDNDGVNNGATVISAGGAAGYLYFNQFLDNTTASLGNGTNNWSLVGHSNVLGGYISVW